MQDQFNSNHAITGTCCCVSRALWRVLSIFFFIEKRPTTSVFGSVSTLSPKWADAQALTFASPVSTAENRKRRHLSPILMVALAAKFVRVRTRKVLFADSHRAKSKKNVPITSSSSGSWGAKEKKPKSVCFVYWQCDIVTCSEQWTRSANECASNGGGGCMHALNWRAQWLNCQGQTSHTRMFWWSVSAKMPIFFAFAIHKIRM